MVMDKEKTEKSSLEYGLNIFSYLFPFAMIGSYYMGWYILFRICAIPVLIVFIANVYGKIKYANWLSLLILMSFFLLFSIIGYYLTNSIIDGICMGSFISIISGMIEKMLRSR